MAGGANVYGFTSGDPVNYDDPLGLDCRYRGEVVPCPTEKQFMKAYADFAGQISNFLAMSWLFGLVEGPTGGGSAEVESAIADDALVVRGGTNTPAQVAAGAEAIEGGLVKGVSVNAASGVSAAEVAASIPHNKVGMTTAGAIRAAGGTIQRDATAANPYHAKVGGVAADVLSGLLTPVTKNPAKP